MSSADWTEILLFMACVLIASPFLGRYCALVYSGRPTLLSPVLVWVERALYSLSTIDPEEEMSWRRYASLLLLFNGLGLLLLFAILRLQHLLPLNPQQFGPLPWLLAFNGAASYVTNTDWQFYAGETTLSYFTQMAGMTVQSFLSAGTGMAVFAALTRSFVAKNSETIGNFFVDLVRSVLYILLPLSIVLALLLVSQGVVQTLHPYVQVRTLEEELQTLPLGPAASQVAIKQLGSNGGGFFHANSAHPFENPTRLSNFLELLGMLLIPAALPFAFGEMTGGKRMGWLLFFVMLGLWGTMLYLSVKTESTLNPILGPRSWLEGKEQRFGMTRSILWFTTTSTSANGAVNASQGSLAPLSEAIALSNMLHGAVVFGAVGVGLCGMLMYCLMTATFGGLIVGKSPEFLSKKIGKSELDWILLSLISTTGLILLGTALTCKIPSAMQALLSNGPHAFSQLFYVFTSTTVNNGSSFSAIKLNGIYYEIVLTLTMIFGRLAILFPCLAVAGGVAKKGLIPPRESVLPTDTYTFALFLAVIIIVTTFLIFLPALCLGPILEQLFMLQGVAF